MSWKPKKWDEEMGAWKLSGMVLLILISFISFVAGKNTDAMTGQLAIQNHGIGIFAVLIICFVGGFLAGTEYKKMRL